MTEGAPFDAGFPEARRVREHRFWRTWADRQRQHLLDCVPLVLAGFASLGILLFFLPSDEPAAWLAVLPVAGLGVLAVWGFRFRRWTRWLVLAPLFVALGFAAATFETRSLGPHLLNEEVRNLTLQATVKQVKWRTDGPRFILMDLDSDEADIEALRQVQMKWRGSVATEEAANLLGKRVTWKVTLLPVRGALLPGGFDFRRQAFFRGLSAYGYSLGAPEVLQAERTPISETLRQTIRGRFQRHMSSNAAGLASALVVGLRGDLSSEAENNIRDAGLAHILAISGLHVGMVTGTLFFLIRFIAALLPGLSLRVQTHRFAAVLAILGALAYFVISGGTVPTQRATIVVTLAMMAILLSRRPFSLRSVGFAALLVLAFQPSSLVTASFQMSFAAVLGLILAFQWRERLRPSADGAGRRALGYLSGLTASSLIATLSTGIFALYHFQQLSMLGIGANIVAVPLTAVWIMPLLLASTLLMPLGWEAPVLWLAEFGLEALLFIARTASAFDQGIITTHDWPAGSLFLAGLGFWLCALVVRPFTGLAALPVAAALLLAAWSSLPVAVANRDEGLLAASSKGPFLNLGERPTGLIYATGTDFSLEQLSKFYNRTAAPCPRDTCRLEGPVWLTMDAQIGAVLCENAPGEQVISLAALPRLACDSERHVDLRRMPRQQSVIFELGEQGIFKAKSAKKGKNQRFWTMEPPR